MSNSKKRVITAIIMGLIILPFIFFGSYFFFGLLAILSFIATLELVRMHNEKRELPKILNYTIPCFSPLLVLLAMIASLINYQNGIKILIFGLVVIVVFLLILTLFFKELKVTDGFFYIGSILYGGLSFSLMGIVRNASIYSTKELVIPGINLTINLGGLALFAFILLVNMLTDVFAYEMGKRFGKHKLIEDVSPNKTIEGSIYGTLFGSILGTAVFVGLELLLGMRLFGINNIILNIIVCLLIAVFLSIMSQIGDLIASKLKREYELKDYGNLFPGHGGVMDRFDSLIISNAIFFIILIIFGVLL